MTLDMEKYFKENPLVAIVRDGNESLFSIIGDYYSCDIYLSKLILSLCLKLFNNLLSYYIILYYIILYNIILLYYILLLNYHLNVSMYLTGRPGPWKHLFP